MKHEMWSYSPFQFSIRRKNKIKMSGGLKVVKFAGLQSGNAAGANPACLISHRLFLMISGTLLRGAPSVAVIR